MGLIWLWLPLSSIPSPSRGALLGLVVEFAGLSPPPTPVLPTGSMKLDDGVPERGSDTKLNADLSELLQHCRAWSRHLEAGCCWKETGRGRNDMFAKRLARHCTPLHITDCGLTGSDLPVRAGQIASSSEL